MINSTTKIVGYGICGKGEADRYLENTLKEFKRLCDDTVIVLNNVSEKEKQMIDGFGFRSYVDNREWGVEQNHIKQDLMYELKKLNPDACVALDMDEVFDPNMSREHLEECFKTGDALYFYIVNLWNEGWNRKWSFWNVRAWLWSEDLKIHNKPLHCGLSPEWTYYSASYSPYFIKHYGLMKKEDRQKKIERYEKYDPHFRYKDRSYYDALSTDDNEPVDDNYIRENLIEEIGVQKKKQAVSVQKNFYYVKSPQGKILDIPEKNLDETLKQGFILVGKIGERVINKRSYNIAYIGKFKKLWDEEYIARSFEDLGHKVLRVSETDSVNYILQAILEFKADLVVFAKLNVVRADWLIMELRLRKIRTICWVFDLYWDYTREPQIKSLPCFKADIVCTTDGGHDQRWLESGITHHTVRQGIYEPECYIKNTKKELDVIFVGSHNPSCPERNEILDKLQKDVDLQWIGKDNTDEVRGTELNELYAKTKIVVGDSVPSPHYWSNRVVETLGRGGFLIHKEVEGIKEEYPYLVTYTDYEDLLAKIRYYLKHDKEREEIVKKNYAWVRDNYTCDKKCSDIIKIYEQGYR